MKPQAAKITKRDGADALARATLVSQRNATESPTLSRWERYAYRWGQGPAHAALSALTLESYEARHSRLSEFQAWDLAANLFERHGATSDELESMERQCDLERVLVLPLVDPDGEATGNATSIASCADALTIALFKRAADRTKPRKQNSPR